MKRLLIFLFAALTYFASMAQNAAHRSPKVLSAPQSSRITGKIVTRSYADSLTDSIAIFGNFTPYVNNPIVSPSGSSTVTAFVSVVYYSGTYYLYYTNISPTEHDIYVTTSADGKTSWTTPVKVLDVGAAGYFDAYSVRCPNVWIEGTTWYMIFGGQCAASGCNAIGLATSPDGYTWTKQNSENPILTGTTGTWDQGDVETTAIIKVDTTYYMYYSKIGSTRQLGIATSTDRINWTKDPANPVMGGGRFCPSVTKWGGYYYMIIPHYTLGTNLSEFELYRDINPTFYPANTTFLGVVKKTSANGWDNGDEDVPFILTDDITRSSFTASNGQWWMYYSGSSNTGTSFSTGLLIANQTQVLSNAISTDTGTGLEYVGQSNINTLNVSKAATFTPDILVDGITVGRGGNASLTNTAFGNSNLKANTLGTSITAFGYQSMSKLTTAVTGITALVGGSNYTSPTITFSAPNAGGTTATGTATVSGGVITGITITNHGSMYSAVPTITIADATGSGASATAVITSGRMNSADGYAALYDLTTGADNVAFGYDAGRNTTTPLQTINTSTFIGYGANSSVDAISNATAIGNSAQVTASNQMVFGNSSVTSTILHGAITGTFAADASPGTAFLESQSGVLKTRTATQVLSDIGGTSLAAVSASGFVKPFRTISSATTITAIDYTIDVTGGTFTQPLPATTLATGQIIVVKNSGTGTITLSGTSIDGSSTLTVNPGLSETLQFTGTSGTYIVIN
jgi:hypothetical protein